MGEVIKILVSTKFRKEELFIELNKPNAKGQQNSVHVQTSNFRWEMPEADFFIIALSTLKAIDNFKKIKKIK
jgi:hypothetical protein